MCRKLLFLCPPVYVTWGFLLVDFTILFPQFFWRRQWQQTMSTYCLKTLGFPLFKTFFSSKKYLLFVYQNLSKHLSEFKLWSWLLVANEVCFYKVDIYFCNSKEKREQTALLFFAAQTYSKHIGECCLVLWSSTVWRYLKWFDTTSGWWKSFVTFLPSWRYILFAGWSNWNSLVPYLTNYFYIPFKNIFINEKNIWTIAHQPLKKLFYDQLNFFYVFTYKILHFTVFLNCIYFHIRVLLTLDTKKILPFLITWIILSVLYFFVIAIYLFASSFFLVFK